MAGTTAAQATTIMRRFVQEVQQGGNLKLLPEFIDPEFVNHSAPASAPGSNAVEAATEMLKGLHAALKDITVTVDHCVSDGHVVATNKILRARVVAPFRGMPATNEFMQLRIMDFVTLRDGKFKDHWASTTEMPEPPKQT